MLLLYPMTNIENLFMKKLPTSISSKIGRVDIDEFISDYYFRHSLNFFGNMRDP